MCLHFGSMVVAILHAIPPLSWHCMVQGNFAFAHRHTDTHIYRQLTFISIPAGRAVSSCPLLLFASVAHWAVALSRYPGTGHVAKTVCEASTASLVPHTVR
ncbi:hypothetical protein BXZ70DRAFT_695254 [Cristinia sonorae]|uniref:Secreted protein n=1 Tax=Cristinia sonorae TaxID=1940300 RepID=A0A8K0UFM9_9AGAR|nr:hypothetical protein BXZ70DRAFT_695254 [Cristinia sonorae]